ncbi:MAG: hypothetical protein QXS69_01640 [Candidatus Aenigmatarchaeota archaeon]
MKPIVVCFEHKGEKLSKEAFSIISDEFKNKEIEFKNFEKRNEFIKYIKDLYEENPLILEIHENVLDKKKEYSIIIYPKKEDLISISKKIEDILKNYNLKTSIEQFLIDENGRKIAERINNYYVCIIDDILCKNTIVLELPALEKNIFIEITKKIVEEFFEYCKNKYKLNQNISPGVGFEPTRA